MSGKSERAPSPKWFSFPSGMPIASFLLIGLAFNKIYVEATRPDLSQDWILNY